MNNVVTETTRSIPGVQKPPASCGRLRDHARKGSPVPYTSAVQREPYGPCLCSSATSPCSPVMPLEEGANCSSELGGISRWNMSGSIWGNSRRFRPPASPDHFHAIHGEKENIFNPNYVLRFKTCLVRFNASQAYHDSVLLFIR